MNNFYELFTVEGDSDLFHVFRFNTKNKSFDHLPSHLAKKLDSTYDFSDIPSTWDDYADSDWSTPILITVILDLLNELKNEFDLNSKVYDSLLAEAREKSNAIIEGAFNLTHLSDEPFIYIFKNITEQECFQLILIDGNCRVNTFRNSQASDARILRDCVWELMWSLGVRDSYLEYYSSVELNELGIVDDDYQKFHRENVKNKISSYLGESRESWIVENGLFSARKYEEGYELKGSEYLEILELITLIKIKTSQVFKKRFE
jgi:hypothetical protein